jgi:hypothetical protein
MPKPLLPFFFSVTYKMFFPASMIALMAIFRKVPFPKLKYLPHSEQGSKKAYYPQPRVINKIMTPA